MECFCVNSREIENRIDPHFYRPYFVEFYEQLAKTKFEFKKIGEISEKVTSGATPLSKGDAYTTQEEGIPFIRSGDINEDKNIDFDDVLYIKDDIHEKKLKGSKLKKGDILIAIVGATIGQVSLYDYDKEANINQAIALVRLDKGINPEYVKAFMISTLGQKQLDRIKRPVARANINLDEIRGINIILPSLEIQNKIVTLMDNAYKEQKNKEEKVSEFLDLINDYVLDELGIKFTDIEEEKIYIVNSEELENTRTDPHYFNPKFKKILSVLEMNKIDLVSLDDVSEKISSGKTPPKDDYSDEGNLILKVNCLRNNKVLWWKLSYFKDGVPAVKTIKNNDILLLSSAHQGEYLGKNPCIAEIPSTLKDDKIYFVGEIISISADTNKINPYYLLAILKLKEYYLLVNREKRGQTSHLYSNDLGKVKIPLPPLSVQNKIADEIKRRMQKAETLQKEAKEELEKAKLEVEKIILS
jgi:restriction endonuclease S subunit